MTLLVVYIGLIIVGDVIAYFVGLAIERTIPGASLPAFLALYFGVLWFAWLLAVRLTAPRPEPQAQ
jgi:cation transporter-like permease